MPKSKGTGEIKPEILTKIKEAAHGGQLTCEQARALAQDLGVAPILVGRACDELKIKIKACQLGCF